MKDESGFTCAVPTRTGHLGGCRCFIVPADVLERFSNDKKLSAEERKSFADTMAFEKEWRKARNAQAKLSRVAQAIVPTALTVGATVAAPAITVYDCAHGNALPGTPVPNPGSSADATAKRAFVETKAVADFYLTVFGRNSVNNAAMTLMSSIHYSVKYNNAFWNGSQMTYGRRRREHLHRLHQVQRRHRPRTHARRDPVFRRPVVR
jgi:hypothetical protein